MLFSVYSFYFVYSLYFVFSVEFVFALDAVYALFAVYGPALTKGWHGQYGDDWENVTNGTDGADGLSAYEVAVSEGYPDSAGAWLDSLVGPAGADGEDGTTADIDTHLNVGTASDEQVLSWNDSSGEYVWIDQTGGGSSYSYKI